MSDSESSALSSPPSTDDEMPEPTPAPKSSVKSISKNNASILSFVESSPARKKRPASPPHEEVLADNPDIAVSRYRVNRVLLDVNYTSTRPASRCASANTIRYAVHCNVQVTLLRCLSYEIASDGTARYRERGC